MKKISRSGPKMSVEAISFLKWCLCLIGDYNELRTLDVHLLEQTKEDREKNNESMALWEYDIINGTYLYIL